MGPITIHITWTLKPRTTTAFFQLLRPLYDHVKTDPACTYFNAFRVGGFGTPKPEDEGDVVRFVEMWDPEGDQELWLREVYPKNETVKKFVAGMEELGYFGKKIEILRGEEGFRYMKGA